MMSDSQEDFNDTFSNVNGNDLDMVIKNIYEACDEFNTGCVQVSKLIDYIKPFMEANVSDLEKLQNTLDPGDNDPEVDPEAFYNAMSTWAKKFNQEESFHNISPRDLENPPLVESTPRKSFGNRQMRVYAEAAALNMSVVEKTSFLGSDSNESVIEKSMLEEQIKQLTHQSKMFNDELALARSQLIGQEEQNLGLQNEIDRLTRDLIHERETVDTLMRQSKSSEEQRETSFSKQKIIDKLQKDIIHLERENQQLQNQIGSIDHERQKTEEKMIRMHEKLSKSRKEVVELRTEVSIKEQQLNFGDELKHDLLSKIESLREANNNLEEANNCLKIEKDKISKLLQDNLKSQSQAVLNYAPQISQAQKIVSPPSLYVIERTGERKVITPDQSQLLEESGNDEELIQVAMYSDRSSPQASLMDELAALREDEPSYTPICANCSLNIGVKRTLEELCDQIQWLKNENCSLRESQDQFTQLIQSKQSLEDEYRQKQRQIDELNRTLQLADEKEQSFLKSIDDLSQNLQEFEKDKEEIDRIKEDLLSRLDEISKLNESVDNLQRENEKLLKTSENDQKLIEKLKDNLKSQESAVKYLNLKLENVRAEKEMLVEEHKMHMDDYSMQMKQYQSDITKLEQKFYASHDQVADLLAQNEQLSTTNAKLFLQNQKLVDTQQDLEGQINVYVKTIDETSTKDLPTKQKLQLLLKAKDNCLKLEARLEQLVDEKKKESDKLIAKIAELESKCAQNLVNNTPRKTAHDRTQIQIEKLREKVDYLEEVVKKEKVKEASLSQEIEYLQRCNEALIKEKLLILKESEEFQCHSNKTKIANEDLRLKLTDLLVNCVTIRRNMLRFGQNWKRIIEKIDSVGGLWTYLADLNVIEDTQDGGLENDFANSQNNLQTVALILDALGNCSLNQVLTYATHEEMKIAKMLNCVSRPMSPDSPNLGVMEFVTSVSGAGDNQGVEFSEKIEESSEDVDDDDFNPLEDLTKMYSSENLEFLLSVLRSEDVLKNQDLHTFVDEFALTFMVECTGYQNRLQSQFEVLQEMTTRLTQHLQMSTTPGTSLTQRKQAMAGAVRCLFELTKSAERFGAIRQEMQASTSLKHLIAYISQMREMFGPKMAAGNLRSETVYQDSINSFPMGSDHGLLSCENGHNRFMSLLNSMRPANVIRLVGVVAFAFIVYYFSQRSVYLLAASDSGGYGGRGQRNSLCWASWLDFLAACIGRLHADGPTPV